MSKAEDREGFLQKHPPLTDAQIKEKFMEADKKKSEYTEDMQELEANLLGYKEIKEPIVDPETGKLLAWMKRPTQVELEKYFQLYDTSEDIKKMTKKDQLDAAQKQYQIMSELLEPEHEAKWWKENSNAMFAKLVVVRLQLFFEQLGVKMENF